MTMRNFERYAEEGQKKIKSNLHYDMTVNDFYALTSKFEAGEISIYELITRAFHAGVEAGSRIEKKKAANISN